MEISVRSKSLIFAIVLMLALSPLALAGLTFTAGQGVTLTSGQGVVLTGADGVVLTGADGVVLTGADGIKLTGADGIVLTGADAITYAGTDGVVLTGADSAGLRSFDPELALIMEQMPDSSAINVFVIFHRMPAEEDLNSLRAIGIAGGTIFHNLPMVLINATKNQIAAISRLPSVRSIYSNKTLEFFTHDTRVITGQSRALSDQSLTRRNGGAPLSGRGITVAVLDTGIDASHPDLSGQVIENVRVADMQGSAPAFVYPQVVGGFSNTDLMGHGTFVAGIIAGTGAASNNYYGGMAPGARLLGISAGDASLFFVLSGIDYIISRRIEQNIRVVNCSFGISGLFDPNDPVNVATKILHDLGISVVFSAGNRGDQPNSLNPYSVAPWVIGVGSATKNGQLSSFSSRGAAGYGLYHPTLVAPGENVVSARASGVNLVGTAGLAGALVSPENDLKNIPPTYLTSYTMSSGTSFAAPHVSGTIALMLEANSQLTPDQIKTILQETATPMPSYSRYEVGAGSLNAHAAVRKAATGAAFGKFRKQLAPSVSYQRDPAAKFEGEIAPGSSYTISFQIPQDVAYLTVQVGWTSNSVASLLTVAASRGQQIYNSNPPTQLAGKRLQRSGLVINDPAPGEWTVTVTNVGGSLQKFVGAIEIIRAAYGDVPELSQFSAAQQQAIKRALRGGLINPGGLLTPATRLELARAIMLGALVPQYLPDSPSFADVALDDPNAVFVESTVNSPKGDLLGAAGSYFNPQAAASRLDAATAAVRALGLEKLAQSSGLINPGLADWNLIPEASRGYVAAALALGLMSADSSTFRPSDPITRAELALMAAALQQIARFK